MPSSTIASNREEPSVLLAGFDAETIHSLRPLVREEEMPLLLADAEPALSEMLADRELAVLCFGPQVPGAAARDVILRRREALPGSRTANVVLAADSEPALFQKLIERGEVFYLTREPLPSSDLLALLRSALDWSHSETPQRVEPHRFSASERLREAVRSILTAPDLGETVELIAQAIHDLVAADRARCLLYSARDATLWSPRREGGEAQGSATSGLSGFVARTGLPLELSRADGDPRYDAAKDNPLGAGDDRWLAVPVRGPQQPVLAVLVALREASKAEFGQAERETLEQLASQTAAHLASFESRAEHGIASPEGQPAALFRREAMEHHQAGLSDQGDLLRISPAWARWTYWLLLAVLIATVLYSTLGQVREYATGPAVVVAGSRVDLTAPSAGTVTAVEVESGQRVAAGQLLVRLYGVQEIAELDRINKEMDLQLFNRLRNLAASGPELALMALQAQKEQAEARLRSRSVLAPEEGVVGDVRVRVGQHLLPGESILSLSRETTGLSVVSLIPGHFRPLIEIGMPLRLELDGYRYAYQNLAVTAVGDEVVGPAEARRTLGAGIADAVPLTGPVVFVHGQLSAPIFHSAGEAYRYYDGMHGSAEIQVRSERIVVALVPGLKALIEKLDG